MTRENDRQRQYEDQELLKGIARIRSLDKKGAGVRGDTAHEFERLKKFNMPKADIRWAMKLQERDIIEVIAEQERRLRLARLLAPGLAAQINLFPDSRSPEEKAYEEGLAVGKQRGDAHNPYDGPAGQEWQRGFNDGTEWINQDLADEFERRDASGNDLGPKADDPGFEGDDAAGDEPADPAGEQNERHDDAGTYDAEREPKAVKSATQQSNDNEAAGEQDDKPKRKGRSAGTGRKKAEPKEGKSKVDVAGDSPAANESGGADAVEPDAGTEQVNAVEPEGEGAGVDAPAESGGDAAGEPEQSAEPSGNADSDGAAGGEGNSVEKRVNDEGLPLHRLDPSDESLSEGDRERLKLRPACRRPSMCGGHGTHVCYACRKIEGVV